MRRQSQFAWVSLFALSFLVAACKQDPQAAAGHFEGKRGAPHEAPPAVKSTLPTNVDGAQRMSKPVAFRSPMRSTSKQWAVPWSNRTKADINGDGRTDILWYNDTIPAVAYWAMDGASVIDTAAYWTAQDYRLLGTGDFDGDGRHDLVWDHPSTKSIFVWQGYDGGFELRPTISYADPIFSWTAAARVADIDGDGKPDLLYERFEPSPFSRHVFQAHIMNAYWLRRIIDRGDGKAPMAGADLLGYGSDQQLSPVVTGSRRLFLVIYDHNGGTFFLAREIQPAPFEGDASRFIAPGDIDGDGIPDLTWFNPGNRTFEIMLMARSGEAIPTPFVRHRRYLQVDPAFDLVAAGDYDGDGFQDDFLWNAPATRELYLWTGRGDTTFDSTYVGHYADGWRVLFTGR